MLLLVLLPTPVLIMSLSGLLHRVRIRLSEAVRVVT